MDALNSVLETITNVVKAFKAFFEGLIAIFKPAEEDENADA